MNIKILAAAVSAIAFAGTAEAQVAVSVWTGQPSSVTNNATIANKPGTSANVTTMVSGINFSTTGGNTSDTTSVGTWLGNPPLSSTTLDNSYMLFTGQIYLNNGANAFTIAHDDGVQLNISGIGDVLTDPTPTAPTTTPFTITAPGAGLYNFTLSYGECCGGPAVLQWKYPSGDPVRGVPEPATWAMMLLGFAGIGTAMRSRRRRELAQIA